MSITKSYPIEIEETADGEGIYFSKGHHDPEEFIGSVLAYIEDCYGEGWALKAKDIRHERWRCIPVAPYEYEPFSHWLVPGKGRGSFPVTVVQA